MKTVSYWLNIADYDLETAKAMLSTGRYLYVGFMCHQVIEKSLKAIIARDLPENEIPPKIHDLGKLAFRANLIEVISKEQLEFIEQLNPLNIEARYPEYKNDLSLTLNTEKCSDIVIKTEEMLCWIKERLQKK